MSQHATQTEAGAPLPSAMTSTAPALVGSTDDAHVGSTDDAQPKNECPSWCTQHKINFDEVTDEITAVHEHLVVVGSAEVVVSMDEGDPDGTVAWVPQLDFVTGQDLRDLIAAFQQAADIVDSEGQPQALNL